MNLRKIIEEIIESNEYDPELIEHFDSFDLENKFKECKNMDAFIEWIIEELEN